MFTFFVQMSCQQKFITKQIHISLFWHFSPHCFQQHRIRFETLWTDPNHFQNEIGSTRVWTGLYFKESSFILERKRYPFQMGLHKESNLMFTLSSEKNSPPRSHWQCKWALSHERYSQSAQVATNDVVSEMRAARCCSSSSPVLVITNHQQNTVTV